MTAACSRAKAVIILDHHKTAAEELASKEAEVKAMPNLFLNIDMDRSGATIARDYFALDLDPPTVGDGNGNSQVDLGLLFAYIEDNDLWRHALPDSKAFSAGIKDYNFEFDANINTGIFDTLVS